MHPDDLATALLGRTSPATSLAMVGHLSSLPSSGVPAPLTFPAGVPGQQPTGSAGAAEAAGTAVAWGSPGQLQRSMGGMALASPPVTSQPLPHDSLASLTAWPGAAEAAAVLHTAAAAVPQAAANMVPLPPKAELMVIRFSLKVRSAMCCQWLHAMVVGRALSAAACNWCLPLAPAASCYRPAARPWQVTHPPTHPTTYHHSPPQSR